jgi:hypothetical protein
VGVSLRVDDPGERPSALTAQTQVSAQGRNFTLSAEAADPFLWVTERWSDGENLWQPGAANVAVRRTETSGLIGGAFTAGFTRRGICSLRLRPEQFEAHVGPRGWLAVLPPEADAVLISIDWLHADGTVDHTLADIRLSEWASSGGSTQYGAL